jgi:hypothetical protein
VEDDVEVIAVGSVRFAFAVAVHPFASVMVTEYAPAVRFVAVVDVLPPGDHE